MRLLFVIALFLTCIHLDAQKNDKVLFSIGDEKVHVSEFKYIYEKNNAKDADYSKESIEEYLDLYKKFKLKVHKAKDVGLDTVKTLQQELAGYRKQLAKSYLKDKEINDRLIDEVVTRMKEDVEVSHIFVSAEAKASDNVKQGAFMKVNEINKKLDTGSPFDMMCKTLSEDRSSANKGGYLGYYTAPLPDGFYEFENAMYETSPGEISNPVKSKMGYHIIKVTNRRPARGQIELAHILLRKKGVNRTLPQTKILADSVYFLLQQGRNFENMAGKFSDDSKTKGKGGYLGFLAINQYDVIFEDAAFTLEKDGDYSKPVETEIGYHIIKRISKRDDSNIELLKKRIKARIANQDRFSIAEKKLIEDVKQDAGYVSNQESLDEFITQLNDEFFTYKWSSPKFDENKVLFELGGDKHTLNDFGQFVKKSVKDRLRYNKVKTFDQAVSELYEKYVDEKVMEYEEKNLENKYPDFKALMREYSEGILLFEITKQEVWDKASKDTTGLRAYYNKNSSKYKWPQRVKVMKYRVDSENETAFISTYKYAQKKDHDKIIDKYKDVEDMKISYEELILDKNDKTLSELKFKSGEISELKIDKTTSTFYKFIELVDPVGKTLEEAKGYVIADYQDYLEKKWIEDLTKSYPIKVNKSVLKSLVK
ncbi:MAG: hypothetical protein HKN67_08410 [Saprospiraceae bacterium]|nr:hypothetical protein [Saprospiraceae bacterium]